ncbi:MAG: M50 family metallopeptidase [Gemmatimonadota bacterium]
MKTKTKRQTALVAGLVAWLVAVWLLWWSPVIYPLKLFVVLLHEASHAGMALATGGHVQRIVLAPDQGGVCYCPGGNAFLVLSAGYLGSLFWGGVILMLARARRPAPRNTTTLIGVAVLLLTALYVRNTFGVLFGALFGAALVALRSAGRTAHVLVLTALGLTSALYALLDIKSDILDRPYLRSDARMLAEMTGVPTVVWGFVWIGLGLAVSWWLFRRALQRA